MVSIWERWEGEEPEAYAAFRYYLEQVAPRRLNALHLVQHVALPTLYGWAQRYQWSRRAEAFDLHFRSVRDEHLEKLMRESAERVAEKHMAALADMREIVGAELAKHLAQIQSSPRSMLSFAEVVRATETVIKADRLIRGLETDNLSIEFGNASLEDLKDLRDRALRVMKPE